MAKEKKDLSVPEITELRSEIATLKAEIKQVSFEKVIRGISDTSQFSKTRKDIARIMTELRKRELAEYTPEQLELRSRLRLRRARLKKK